MHIKRFEAPTIEAALAKVKAELGADALILSTRTLRRGGAMFGLMAREVVEVQAALERKLPSTTGSVGSPARPLVDSTSRGKFETDAESLLSEIRKELCFLRGRERFEEEVRSELRGLRTAIQSVVAGPVGFGSDPAVRSMASAGMDWMHAESLITEWRQAGDSGDRNDLEAALTARIEARLAPARDHGAGGIRIFVGAPGVGKTTTLAKLAARNEEGERDVALLSLDHFRIGATDQLRRYAKMLESPFREVACAADLSDEVGKFSGNAVLIDTAGRSERGEQGLESLLPLREILGREASIELVVDATARRDVQRAQLTRFAPLRPDRIIFAKTDECESLAAMTNLLLDDDCPPLCWMGTGQRVPEDLELVDASRLARDVLGAAGMAA